MMDGLARSAVLLVGDLHCCSIGREELGEWRSLGQLFAVLPEPNVADTELSSSCGSHPLSVALDLARLGVLSASEKKVEGDECKVPCCFVYFVTGITFYIKTFMFICARWF